MNLQIEGSAPSKDEGAYVVSVRIMNAPDDRAEALCDSIGRMIARTLAEMGGLFVPPVSH